MTFKGGLAHPPLLSHSGPAAKGLMSLPVEKDAVTVQAQYDGGIVQNSAVVLPCNRPRSKLLQAGVTLDLNAEQMSKTIISAPL